MMSITKDKKNILLFFAAPFLVCAVYILLIVALDPFGLFHKHGIKIGVLNNMRIQAAGAINSADFDSVILGSSVLENTSAKDASDILGGKFVNLSISGSTFFERAFILEALVRDKKLNRVLYSLDAVYVNPVYEIPNYPASRFDFLYNESKWDNIYAYFDFAIAGCLFKSALGSSCMGNDYAFDRPNAWMNLPEHATRFGGLQNWLRAENNHQIVDALTTITRDVDLIRTKNYDRYTKDDESKAIRTAIEYAEKSILSYVRANPHVQFDLVFPPYSRIVFAQWNQIHRIDVPVHNALQEYLVAQAQSLPNLAIYGYEDMDFLDDLSNYKDTVHYSPDYNVQMLEWVRDGKHRLTPKNLATYQEIAKKKANEFDMIGLGKTFDDYLKKKKGV